MKAIPVDHNHISSYSFLGLLFVLVFRLALHALVYRAGFQSITSDEFGRIVLAARWAQQPYWIWQGGWLPFGEYLFGSALFFFRELLWVPRYIAIFFGLISIIFIYYLSIALFSDQQIALLSSLLMAVNPIHLQLSSVPLTDMLYGALVIGMAWSFSLFLKSSDVKAAVLAAIFMAFANGFRFEAWVVSVVFSAFLLVNIISKVRQNGNNKKIFTLIGSLILPWIFPSLWIASNYLRSGQILSSLEIVRVYKATWQAAGTDYFAYARAFFSTDPLLAILAPFGLLLLLKHGCQPRFKLWYLCLCTIPFLTFIALHRGQIEPAGIMFRYMGLYIFIFYPAEANLIISSLRHFTTSERMNRTILMLVVILFLIFQVNNNFLLINNDQTSNGLEVGQTIRAIRKTRPEISQKPVMIELIYWEYVAIQVGANDVNGVLYDRDLDLEHRQSASWILSDLEALRSCLASAQVSFVILKSPALQHTVEEEIGLVSSDIVNGYTFYPVPEAIITASPYTGSCPSR